MVRAERWQYLLEPLGHTRFWVAFRTTVIGFAASSRVAGARRRSAAALSAGAAAKGCSATAAFATIVVERILDLVAVLLLLAVYLLAFDPGVDARDPALFARSGSAA